MVKLKKLFNSYVNVSGNLYDSEFINLVQVKNDHICFDDRTIFLDEEKKEVLNSQRIVRNVPGVYIIDNAGVKGIICNLPISEYKRGAVKNHELVLPGTIQGMLSNYHGYNAEAAPVMLLANKRLDFETFMSEHKPEMSYSVKNVSVSFYSGDVAESLLSFFDGVDSLFVGDGHHRLYSTSLSGFKDNVLS